MQVINKILYLMGILINVSPKLNDVMWNCLSNLRFKLKVLTADLSVSTPEIAWRQSDLM